MFEFSLLKIMPSDFEAYVTEVCNHYHERPFHNFQHAVTVTHMTFLLINAMKAMDVMSPDEMFALLLSALVHDVDHPGNTNGFEINTDSTLAMRYNDEAVLENHHCSKAFSLMNPVLFRNLSVPRNRKIRKMMISCIMATDMSRHNDILKKIKEKLTTGWNFDKYEDVLFLGQVILHAADLSNPTRPFFMSVAWARKIYEEFNQQVVIERAQDLPVLDFMVTLTEEEFNTKETGFVSHVVAPMWRDLAELFPGVKRLADQLDVSAQRVG